MCDGRTGTPSSTGRRGRAAGKPVIVPFAFLTLSDERGGNARAPPSVVDRYPSAAAAAALEGERYGHDRIRIAYLSADFHEHAVAYLDGRHVRTARSSALRNHRHRLRPGPREPDARPARGGVRALRRRPQARATAEAARLLRELEIDIAVDLMGFTQHSRTGIFAPRPAPVQVNYLGYPGTMGAPYIDYIMADRILIPEANAQHYAEKVVYLPDTFQVNDSKRRIAEARRREREAGTCRSRASCSAASTTASRSRPRCSTIWMRLLPRVPGSVLWLLAGNRWSKRNLRREARARGVDPERAGVCAADARAEHTSRGIGWPICSSIRCRSTAARRRATRCGRDCLCSPARARRLRRAWRAACCTRSGCRNWSRTPWPTTRR